MDVRRTNPMVLVMPPNWIVEKQNEKIEHLIKNKNKVHPASLGQKKKMILKLVHAKNGKNKQNPK